MLPQLIKPGGTRADIGNDIPAAHQSRQIGDRLPESPETQIGEEVRSQEPGRCREIILEIERIVGRGSRPGQDAAYQRGLVRDELERAVDVIESHDLI